MPLETDGVREHVFVKIEPLDEERVAPVKVEPWATETVKREPQEQARVKTEPNDAASVKTEPVDLDEGVRVKLEADNYGLLQPAYATFEVSMTDVTRKTASLCPGWEELAARTDAGPEPPAARFFECDECGKRCSTKENLRNHIFSHPHMRLACPVCGRLVSRLYLRRHVAGHAAGPTRAPARRYPCARCGAVFRARPELDAHAAAHCGDLPELAEFSARLAGRRRHGCALCPQTFLTRQNAKRHHERVHNDRLPYQCPVCHKRFKYSSSFHDHKLTHAEKQFSCEICHKQFALKAYLTEHLYVHTGEKGEYKCDKCDFTCRSRYKLGRHELTHTGVKPFSCDVCLRSFTTAFWLRRHVEAHAGGGPAHECADCGKRFTQKANLVDHRKMHTGEGYACSVCGEKFPTRGLMRGHKRTHGGLRLTCGKCGKDFVRPCLLAQHEQRHAQQEKGLVNVPQQKENNHSGVTQQQEKKHTGVTQQQEKGHVGVSVTRQPARRHAGVPASTCRVCGKAFPLASALRRHVDMWHKDVSRPDSAQTNVSNC